MSAPPVLDAYSGALNEAYADATAFLQQCFPYVEEIGKYLKTASVARDMLHIVEKMEHDKIRYWGFSYGTYIGATFAALFPDKIERMVNDGWYPDHIPHSDIHILHTDDRRKRGCC